MRDADADDELSPVIGERYRDVLAERAIALLADWDTEPPARPCERLGGQDVRNHPQSARGPHARILKGI